MANGLDPGCPCSAGGEALFHFLGDPGWSDLLVMLKAVDCEFSSSSVAQDSPVGDPNSSLPYRQEDSPQSGSESVAMIVAEYPPEGILGNATIDLADSAQPTLRHIIRGLADIDPRTTFIARRIQHFGFRSPTVLSEYFSRFGGVRNIFVSHSYQIGTDKCRAAKFR